MATISKFYFHDVPTPYGGGVPGTSDAYPVGRDATGDATGARISRAADDVIGIAQTSSTFTSLANISLQDWGHRRFVSPPLAAHTFATGDGNWTFSYARSESNTNHNGQISCIMSIWRPSSGALVGALAQINGTVISSTSEVADSVTNLSSNRTCIDGDVILFEIYDEFTQSMGIAYTSSFFYDGTTEGSATTCASFVSPPAALTLAVVTPPAAVHPHLPFVKR